MKRSKLIGWNPVKIREEMTAKAIALQTERFIEYAEREVKKIGDMMMTYNSANHLDRTGNLLNSICWGVTYNGERKASGFYRDAVIHTYTNRWGQERGMGTKGGTSSFLHEFFGGTEEVNGRQRAENFIESYKGKAKGWSVFFAVLAPYWGYWESGFTMRGGGGTSGVPRQSRFMQFQVMTHIFDDVISELKPAKTRFTVYVPKYSYRARSSEGKKYKNKSFVPKIG